MKAITARLLVVLVLVVGLLVAAGPAPALAYDGCPSGSPGGSGYPAITGRVGSGPTTTSPTGTGHQNWTLAAYGHTGACVLYTLQISEYGYAGGPFTATYGDYVRVWTCGTYRGSFGAAGTNGAGTLLVTVGPFSYHGTIPCGLQADTYPAYWSASGANPSFQTLDLTFP